MCTVFLALAALTNVLVSLPIVLDETSTARVSVTVRDENGMPIPDATVAAYLWTGKMQQIGKPQHTDMNGITTIEKIPSGETLYVSVVVAGMAPTEQQIQLGKDEHKELKVNLKPSTASWIKLCDPNGRAVEDAQLQRADFVDPDGRQVAIVESTAGSLGVELSKSDREGRLKLPALFEGAKITAWICHPDWRLTKLENLLATSGELRTVVMQPGVPVQISLTSPGIDLRELEGLPVEIRMIPADGGNDSQHVMFRKVAVKNSEIRFTVSPVKYNSLILLADHHYLTPWLGSNLTREEIVLDLRKREELKHSVVIRRATKVRGRVVSPDKQPLSKVYVRSRISNLSPAGIIGDHSSDRWANGGHCETDESGRFEVDAVEGLVAVEAFLDGYFRSPSKFEFEATCKITETPDIQLTPLPTLRGRVMTAAAKPVKGVFTRIRSTGRGYDSTVSFTDENGRFELPVAHVQPTYDSEGLQTTVFILAIDPESGDAGRMEIDLTSPSSLSDLQVTIKPQVPGWILNPLADQPFGMRSDEEEVARRQLHTERTSKYPAGVFGQIPPDLSRGTWLNTEARSLADFKGQFVLIDFWFIGCGPCHADFPTVRATYDAFRESGFTVVSVHTNSQSPETVGAYAKTHGMNFPVVIDNSEGTLSRDYEALGVFSYPSYLLIDPDGRILINDNIADPDQPYLRKNKTEAVFHALQMWKREEK